MLSRVLRCLILLSPIFYACQSLHLSVPPFFLSKTSTAPFICHSQVLSRVIRSLFLLFTTHSLHVLYTPLCLAFYSMLTHILHNLSSFGVIKGLGSLTLLFSHTFLGCQSLHITVLYFVLASFFLQICHRNLVNRFKLFNSVQPHIPCIQVSSPHSVTVWYSVYSISIKP